MRRLLVLPLLCGLLVGAGAATAGPASARSGSAVRWRGVITFTKNHTHPDRSRISWVLRKQVGTSSRVVDRAHWRAGSGMLGKRGRNACVHNVGWLPNGRYRVRQYADYHGHVIKGRAFRIDNKRCRAGGRRGTTRHNLFIHTEQGARNHQCRNRRGDQPCRWEYPRIDDYKSAGCIKLAPGDLKSLVAHFHRAFHAGRRYAKRRVVLRVVG